MSHSLPLFILLFSFTFFSSTHFFPHSHQIYFLFLHSPSCLFIKSSSSPKIQFFFFTQKTRRKKYITHTKNEKKKLQLQKKNLAVEEEARNNSGFMCLCWNWELHIWFRILQSVWLVRSWRKWKERRTTITNHYYLHGAILLLGVLQLMRMEHRV